MDWIKDMDHQAWFLWLYGPTGAGKSAIEQTIAKQMIAKPCYKVNYLASSFFFSHNSTGRNEETVLMTTIVSQHIVSIPEIHEHIENSLYSDPSLL
jgi:DNA replication protein DnaC